MSESIPTGSLRVVVDTNLFVSGLLIWPDSLPARLIDALLAQTFGLITSAALAAEVAEVLGRPALTERYQADEAISKTLLNRLAIIEQVPMLLTLPVAVRDLKDEMVLACAVAGNVDYLVSGDENLLVLDGNPALGSLRIVAVRAFLALLGGESEG